MGQVIRSQHISSLKYDGYIQTERKGAVFIMKKSPNGFMKNIKLIVTVISLYPWLLILLMMMGSGGSSGSAYGAGLFIFFIFMILSVINLVISAIVLVVANVSNPPLAKGSAKYFFAMNSISLLWIMPLVAPY